MKEREGHAHAHAECSAHLSQPHSIHFTYSLPHPAHHKKGVAQTTKGWSYLPIKWYLSMPLESKHEDASANLLLTRSFSLASASLRRAKDTLTVLLPAVNGKIGLKGGTGTGKQFHTVSEWGRGMGPIMGKRLLLTLSFAYEGAQYM